MGVQGVDRKMCRVLDKERLRMALCRWAWSVALFVEPRATSSLCETVTVHESIELVNDRGIEYVDERGFCVYYLG